jgi:hypothetical protein
MPHYVFANGNEIAAQSADGASIACAPDVCFSPGAPMPGVPVPYANTVRAADLANLSRTVFFKGTGGALEDISFFATSTGNEPATPGLKKGTVTGQIKGKAHFKTWSMNVKVEGKGIARHLDTVTHNHNSPPNALVQRYRSVWDRDIDCARDRQQMERACRDQGDAARANKLKRSPFRRILEGAGRIAAIPDQMAQRAYGYRHRAGAANAWLEDHCDGQWVKPTSASQTFRQAQAEFEGLLDKLANDRMFVAQAVFGEILQMAKDQLSPWFLIRKLGGLALRSLLKNVVGGAAAVTGVGTIVTAGMAAWTITDFIDTATELAAQLGPLAQEHLDDLLNLDRLQQMARDKLAEYRNNPSKFMADAMTASAATNPCLRARKCMLVPYRETSAARAARNGQGCCPGQTGHHVLPGAMFEGNPCYAGKHANAPTICLEGVNNSHGSHGAAHRRLQDLIRDHRRAAGDTMTYAQARDAAVAAITTPPTAPAAGCNRDCLKKQLDAFYEECRNSTLRAHDGMGGADASRSAGDGDID